MLQTGNSILNLQAQEQSLNLQKPGRFLKFAGPRAQRYCEAKGFFKTAIKIVIWIVTLSLFQRLMTALKERFQKMQVANLTKLQAHAEASLDNALAALNEAEGAFVSATYTYDLAKKVATVIGKNYTTYLEKVKKEGSIAEWSHAYKLNADQNFEIAKLIVNQEAADKKFIEFSFDKFCKAYRLEGKYRQEFLKFVIEKGIIPIPEGLSQEEQNFIAVQVIRNFKPLVEKLLNYQHINAENRVEIAKLMFNQKEADKKLIVFSFDEFCKAYRLEGKYREEFLKFIVIEKGVIPIHDGLSQEEQNWIADQVINHHSSKSIIEKLLEYNLIDPDKQTLLLKHANTDRQLVGTPAKSKAIKKWGKGKDSDLARELVKIFIEERSKVVANQLLGLQIEELVEGLKKLIQEIMDGVTYKLKDAAKRNMIEILSEEKFWIEGEKSLLEAAKKQLIPAALKLNPVNSH